MKNELVHYGRYRTREDVEKEITKYIEVFYNRERYQKRLDYLSLGLLILVIYGKKFYVQRVAAEEAQLVFIIEIGGRF